MSDMPGSRPQRWPTYLAWSGPVVLMLVMGAFAAGEYLAFGQSRNSISQYLIFTTVIVALVWHFCLVAIARPWWAFLLFAVVHIPILLLVAMYALPLVGGGL